MTRFYPGGVLGLRIGSFLFERVFLGTNLPRSLRVGTKVGKEIEKEGGVPDGGSGNFIAVVGTAASVEFPRSGATTGEQVTRVGSLLKGICI